MYRTLFGAPLRKVAGPVLVMSLAVVGLSACSSSSSEDNASVGSSDTDSSHAMAEFVVTAAWAKAADAQGEHPMTGVFMELTNSSKIDITVEAASTDVATMTQLHETIARANGSTVMQEVKGGLVVPAGGTRTLEPGGDHVMLMGLTEDLVPGDSVELTLALDNGEMVHVRAPIRDFSGAQEEYSHEETGQAHESHHEH